jgi:alpha-mannosidase
MRGIRFLILVVIGCASIRGAGAAVRESGPSGSGRELVLQGYLRNLSGETMLYHSPLPGERPALITRAAPGWQPIVWESEAVRDDAKEVARGVTGEPVIRFAWLAGLGCNLGTPSFTLTVAGFDSIPFRVEDRETWTATGSHGLTLSFRSLLRDHYGDRFGLMTLDLPRGRARAGEPLRLSIAGEHTGSQAWVMTFQEPLMQGIVATPQAMILRGPGGGAQPVDLSILHLGDTTEATIRAEGIETIRKAVPFGLTTLRVEFPPATADRNVTLEIEIDRSTSRREVTLRPVRPWTIHLVQHTHTDIGYTRPQTEILADHLRYIDYALDYCDATDSLPDEARFRWTCEVSWPVHEYLLVRPQSQIERLKRRVHEGRIELTAMPLNMGEVADERVLASSLRWIAEARAAGLPVPTAMQNDVNGFPWSMLDPLAELGVRFLSMGENTHRAMKPFEVPTAFRWESPSGKQLLTYRSDHYMTANFWGILDGDRNRLGTQMLEYLRGLEAGGYADNEVAVQYVGYFTDNAPPSTFANETIRHWNEEVVWPHLQTSTMGSFLAAQEARRGEALAVVRAAWPDWWTDGFGSAMRETAAVRRAQAEQTVNLGLLSMVRLLGDPVPAPLLARADAIDDLLLFYDEHTFGASESVTDPMAENSQVQWLEKASYAWQSVMQARQLREAALGLLEPHLAADPLPTVTVFNTLGHVRSGPVTLFIDHQLLPRDAAFTIADEAGREAVMQRVSSRMEGSVWTLWADDVPAFGLKTYRIRVSGPSAPAETPAVSNGILENDWYKITIDPARGGIVSILDKELKIELVDSKCAHSLGEAVYERLDERSSMERRTLGGHRRVSWSDVSIENGDDGPVWSSTILSGRLEGFDGLRCEIRLYRTAKRIEIVYQGRKLPVTDPEALYVALPFELTDGRIAFEAQGGEIVPGDGQLRGTSNDWNTVQTYASVRNRRAQIVLTSDDAPLLQFGGINTGRYDPDARPASNNIYSFVLNNYWVTNFRASQEGDLRWCYSIVSTPDPAPAHAARLGWDARIPLVARVRPSASSSRPADPVPGLDLDRVGVLLLAASPSRDGDGIVLHLRETAGRGDPLSGWSPSNGRAARVDPLGGAMGGSHPRILEPLATSFVKVEVH